MTLNRTLRSTLATVTFVAALAAASACSTVSERLGDVMPETDIVDTAIANGSFTTLVAAIEAAGLTDTLKGDGPFTVFAPTDEAFEQLPEGTVENLLLEANRDQLAAILTYHVLPGKVMSSDIAGQSLSPATVNGQTLDIDASDGVMVNGASVITADVEASNGVIHVIDTVLLPQ